MTNLLKLISLIIALLKKSANRAVVKSVWEKLRFLLAYSMKNPTSQGVDFIALFLQMGWVILRFPEITCT